MSGIKIAPSILSADLLNLEAKLSILQKSGSASLLARIKALKESISNKI